LQIRIANETLPPPQRDQHVSICAQNQGSAGTLADVPFGRKAILAVAKDANGADLLIGCELVSVDDDAATSPPEIHLTLIDQSKVVPTPKCALSAKCQGQPC
jgi:hypothetical protein